MNLYSSNVIITCTCTDKHEIRRKSQQFTDIVNLKYPDFTFKNDLINATDWHMVPPTAKG